MKKLVCALLIIAFMFSASFSVSAAPALEDLEVPFEENLKEYSDNLRCKNVYDMTVYNGRLFVGWGDYGENIGTKLGGLPLLSYLDATNSWQIDTILDDEEIHRFFQHDGKLYITGTDPIKRVGSVYVKDETGTWSILSTFDGGTHVYDMVINDGTMYVCYGQNGGDKAVVRYSTDFKNFHDAEFRFEGEAVVPRVGFARSYNMFEFGGNVYATLKINGGDEHLNGIYKLDKNEMAFNYVGKGQSHVLITGTPATFDAEFNGYYLCAREVMTYTKNPEDDNGWKTMDKLDGKITCIKVIDGTLYLLAYTENGGGFTNTLYKTKDLETFEKVYDFDYSAYVQSFCYDNENETFYFGTGGRSYGSPEGVGTVFSLKANASVKGDMAIRVSPKGDSETEPKWVRYALKLGDTVIKDGMLYKSSGWEEVFEGVDLDANWSVEIISDSVGYEWDVQRQDNAFVLTNKIKSATDPEKEEQLQENPPENEPKNDGLIILLSVLGGTVLLGAVGTVVFITLRKKRK